MMTVLVNTYVRPKLVALYTLIGLAPSILPGP